jgi:hypothetical protein|tara:strand:+ start:350 stop:631 length:282 start_codon:yes stop_codon:yes gene_type:complete
VFALKTALSDIQNFGVCLFGENFVTPFSTLANIKGSIPTNLTTPDRLRCRTKTDAGEDFLAVFIAGSNIYRIQKKVLTKGPASSGDLHPKRNP